MSVIRHIRVNLFGLSQAAFAAEIGASQSKISRVESGVAELSLGLARKIRDAALKRGIAWDDALLFEDDIKSDQGRH